LLGDASYALYLVHPFVIRAGREAVLATGLAAALGGWGFVLSMLAAAMAASLLVHHLFERPVTDWVRRRLESPRTGSAKAVAGLAPDRALDS
jgi:peptidoglycan/LPS O-acetylase OafA/YrhL